MTNTERIVSIRMILTPKECKLFIKYLTPGKNGDSISIINNALQVYVEAHTFNIDEKGELIIEDTKLKKRE